MEPGERMPLVFHQGRKNWNSSRRFSDYFELDHLPPGEWRDFVPKFEHVLVDLSRLNWDEIRGDALLRVTFEARRQIMTLAEAIRREGREEGPFIG
jgi:hypothetical protein